jgi:hypothetical protein
MKRRDFIKTTAIATPMLSLFPSDLSAIKRNAEAGKLEKRSLGRTGQMLSMIGFGGIVVKDTSTEEAAMASLEQKNLLKTKGEKTDEKGNVVKDQGAVIGRGINQIENLGKVAGGVIAGGFTKLNEKMGNTINTTFPDFDAKLKGLSSTLQVTTPVSKGGEAVRNGPGAITKPAAGADAGKAAGTTNASVADASSNTEVKDLLTQLNNKMAELVSISSDTNENASKQVRATRNLSGNRLN